MLGKKGNGMSHVSDGVKENTRTKTRYVLIVEVQSIMASSELSPHLTR